MYPLFGGVNEKFHSIRDKVLCRRVSVQVFLHLTSFRVLCEVARVVGCMLKTKPKMGTSSREP